MRLTLDDLFALLPAYMRLRDADEGAAVKSRLAPTDPRLPVDFGPLRTLASLIAREAQVVSVSEVTFMALDDDAIAAYLATDEWKGKAGAYAIQGRAESFVQHLSGSYSGVMGLPLHETAQLLKSFGVQ